MDYARPREVIRKRTETDFLLVPRFWPRIKADKGRRGGLGGGAVADDRYHLRRRTRLETNTNFLGSGRVEGYVRDSKTCHEFS